MEELCNFISSCFEYCDVESINCCETDFGSCCEMIKDCGCPDFECPNCNFQCFPQFSQMNCNPFDTQCCSYVEANCLSSFRCYHMVEEVSTVIQSTGQAVSSMISNFSENLSWMLPNNCLISVGIDPNDQVSNQVSIESRKKIPSFSLLEEEITMKELKNLNEDNN